ncbi:DUF3077 domain-containing protein [Pseudomonas fluorescens]|uniref:DUF3077 domain-containing protein n=1 Tax=Pseudomonas fluorescens TaxID=294 RepID=A0AAE2U7U8_PSEFL|nr:MULTISPECIES: DUF3077 domain-containing protein [Pseudomonas fluorescens group]MBA1429950.1 DUF3077 domain-containing protein [Pseudomonas orientalis]MBD8148816.1 DUF3077 domain-containing protein [Pseudomonas fluorescens]MBD8176301.1 DUF3077 domain-containing protein [Pseudomonas fluorescens]MBD8272829.1 DUF3077 domain-containing protein [Pseudomonas fluorescens]MBD8745160.1 DUF3077 domain-containing protein [Pseudomonas fluorescens]
MTTSPYSLPETPEHTELHDMRCSGAAQRALDYYLKEEMSAPASDSTFFTLKPGISQEEALVHASDLLRSAAATAYESASSHQGSQRDLAFSVVYLIDMAKAMVERSLRTPDAHANG